MAKPFDQDIDIQMAMQTAYTELILKQGLEQGMIVVSVSDEWQGCAAKTD